MLRVTVASTGKVADLKIEGSIANPDARELWRECRRQKDSGRRLRLDISGVTQADEMSIKRLKRLMRGGAEVVGASLFLSALLEDEP